MRFHLFLSWIIASFFCIPVAQAGLLGLDVVLVHGFNYSDLEKRPDRERSIELRKGYWPEQWDLVAEAQISWASQERIEGGVMEAFVDQVKVLQQRTGGFCTISKGCLFITHSTGDLVLRYFLENQEDWLDTPLNVLAVIDIAGAGGGSELAQVMVSAVNGNLQGAQKTAIEFAFDISATSTLSDLGALVDITPNAARNLATAPNTIPRLRIIGGGSSVLVSGFLATGNDGAVAFHSACGSSEPINYESCAPYVGPDGKLSDYSAPKTFFYNHFPLWMLASAAHRDLIRAIIGTSSITFVHNNFAIAPQKVIRFGTETKAPDTFLGSFFGSSTQRVVGSGSSAMSPLLIEVLGGPKRSTGNRLNLAETLVPDPEVSSTVSTSDDSVSSTRISTTSPKKYHSTKHSTSSKTTDSSLHFIAEEIDSKTHVRIRPQREKTRDSLQDHSTNIGEDSALIENPSENVQASATPSTENNPLDQSFYGGWGALDVSTNPRDSNRQQGSQVIITGKEAQSIGAVIISSKESSSILSKSDSSSENLVQP